MLWSSLQNGRSETLPDSRMQSQSLESQRTAESVLTAMSRLRATMLRSSITQNLYKKPEWEFAGIYSDDGISGTNTKKREDFNRMIEYCEAGNIDMIITKSISRFARNTLDCLKYIRQLKDKNIPVFFEKEVINIMDAKGEVLITIMASLAQQESQSLSQNVKLGLQFRYQNGQVQVIIITSSATPRMQMEISSSIQNRQRW